MKREIFVMRAVTKNRKKVKEIGDSTSADILTESTNADEPPAVTESYGKNNQISMQEHATTGTTTPTKDPSTEVCISSDKPGCPEGITKHYTNTDAPRRFQSGFNKDP